MDIQKAPNLFPGIIYRRLLNTAAIFSVLLVCLGSTVEIGWWRDNTLLKSIFPGIVAMNPVTAILFIAGGITLGILVITHKQFLSKNESLKESDKDPLHFNNYVLFFFFFVIVAMLLVGIIRLLGIFSTIDLHVDQLLFYKKMQAVVIFGKNRIAPNTAASFVLTALALWLTITKKLPKIAQSFSLLSITVAFLAILGYAYSVSDLYTFLTYTPMALNTALAFMMLNLGLLCISGLTGFMRIVTMEYAGGIVARKLIPAVIIIPAILGWIHIVGEQSGLYSHEYGRSILIVAIIITFILFIYDLSRQLNELDQIRQQAQLNADNTRNDLQELNKTLDQQLLESQQQNKLLEDTKRASVNILEDFQEEKEHTEEEKKRLAIQYETLKILESSSNVTDALQKVLEIVCQSVQLPGGSFWEWNDQLNVLERKVSYGQSSNKLFIKFLKETEGVTFAPGIGLPGRIYQSKEPVWLEDIVTAKNSPLSAIAEKVKLHASFGFPVTTRGYVRGIIEFFDTDIQKSNPELLASLNAVASQIGLFIERREILDNLAQAKAKDDAILQGIGDAVFVIDASNQIILFNPIAEQISGFTQNEALGKNYRDILNFQFEDSGKLNYKFIETALQGKRSSMSEHTIIITKNGQKIPVADSAAPILDADKKVVGVVIVFRDVTEERAIDRAKTEFVSLASHQLRTPLSSTSWYSEMLLSGDAGKLSKDQKDFVTEIYQSNKRMIDLVNSLLNVSRIDLGNFAIDPKPTDIPELIESILKEVAIQIKKRKLVISKKFDATVTQFQADQQLMRMIVQNLLTNAVKYTPEKGTIRLAVEKKGKNIRIIVADTGYGIPQDQQTKIFNKLFRADNAIQKEADGNGLGLYIVKAIVEQAGGKIWFESEENKGSTFYVELPLSGMKKSGGAKALT